LVDFLISHFIIVTNLDLNRRFSKLKKTMGTTL
jgi:hypothetical protein